MWTHHLYKALFVGVLLLVQSALTWADTSSSDFPESFRITSGLISLLEGYDLPKPLLKSLETLNQKTFLSQESFLAALQGLKNPPQTERETKLLLQAARLDKLMIRSENFSGDMKEGEAVFQGNVVGEFPQEQASFKAGKVRVLAEGTNTYTKIVAETQVHVKRLDHEVTAGHATYNRIQRILHLEGRVVLKSEKVYVSAAVLHVNGILQTLEAKGALNRYSDTAVQMRFKWKEPEDTVYQNATAQAQRIFIEKQKNQVLLEGNVIFEQAERQLFLKAGKLLLTFNDQEELIFTEAQQSVCFEQPGRAAKANKAVFDETQQTILLEGNAIASAKDTNVSGETLLLHLDVNKGVVKGDSRSPIEVTFSLDESSPEPSIISQPLRCR